MGKAKANCPPAGRLPESKLPLVAVTVWARSSLFAHVTRPPGTTATPRGEKARPTMATLASWAGAAPAVGPAGSEATAPAPASVVVVVAPAPTAAVLPAVAVLAGTRFGPGGTVPPDHAEGQDGHHQGEQDPPHALLFGPSGGMSRKFPVTSSGWGRC